MSSLLKQSGVNTPLTFQPVWRSDERKAALDAMFATEWVGRKTLADARAFLRRSPEHFGLQHNRSGFAIRVPLSGVAGLRSLAKPTDARFDEHNRSIAGRLRFRVYGVPEGTGNGELATLLRDSLQWTAIVAAPFRRNGHLTFPVFADAAPSKDCFHLKSGPVLVRPWVVSELKKPAVLKPRANRASPQPAQQPPVKPSALLTGPAAIPAAHVPAVSTVAPNHEARFAAIERRLADQETRTKSLESTVEAGFSQVLARLDALAAPAATNA